MIACLCMRVCVCVCLCVCLCVCALSPVMVSERISKHSSSEGWRSQTKSFTTLPTKQWYQWHLHNCRGENERTTAGLNVWMPPKFLFVCFLFVFLCTSYLKVPLSLTLLCPQKGKLKQYFVSMTESFTVTYCYHGFGIHTTRLYLSVFVQERNCSRNRFVKSQGWQGGEEKKRGENLQQRNMW